MRCTMLLQPAVQAHAKLCTQGKGLQTADVWDVSLGCSAMSLQHSHMCVSKCRGTYGASSRWCA